MSSSNTRSIISISFVHSPSISLLVRTSEISASKSLAKNFQTPKNPISTNGKIWKNSHILLIDSWVNSAIQIPATVSEHRSTVTPQNGLEKGVSDFEKYFRHEIKGVEFLFYAGLMPTQWPIKALLTASVLPDPPDHDPGWSDPWSDLIWSDPRSRIRSGSDHFWNLWIRIRSCFGSFFHVIQNDPKICNFSLKNGQFRPKFWNFLAKIMKFSTDYQRKI